MPVFDAAGEFDESIPIRKLHRFFVELDGKVHFGLLGIDGKIHYFNGNAAALRNISRETYEFARLSLHLADGEVAETFAPSNLPIPIPISPDGLVKPFVGPELKLVRAYELLDRLADILESFGEISKLTAVQIGKTEKNSIWQMQWNVDPPAVIPLIMGDIVHNLRSSLDITICDIARIRGLAINKLKFPFAESKENLIRVLEKETKPLGDDVCSAIFALEPYKNGNHMLRGLHDLDIIDKHRLVVPTYAVSWKKFNFAQAVMDQMAEQNPNAKAIKIMALGNMNYRSMHAGQTFEYPTGQNPMEYYEEIETSFEVIFPLVDEIPFGSMPIYQTLSNLADMAKQIFEDFRAKFGAVEVQAE